MAGVEVKARTALVTVQTLHVDGGASFASPDFPMEFQRDP